MTGPAVPVPTPPPVAEAPAAETYGRVEADGTVFVRTSSGEVRVGQYQAGDLDQALTYFARKYRTLEVEVEVLEKRLASGADVSIDDAQASVERLKAALVEPQVVGDIDGLRARVDRLGPLLEARRQSVRAQKTALREAAKAERERIVSEAEALAESTSWKSSGDRLKALLEEWKAAPHVDRGVEQTMWKRFSAARNSFDRHRRAHFAKLATEQDAAKETKEGLVAEATKLADSTDWTNTANEMRKLMDRWKTAGRAGRAADDHLWQEFRSAQDKFYEARSASMAERDADLSNNLVAKEALATEAERIVPVGDLATREGHPARRPGALGEGRTSPASRPRPRRGTAQAGRAIRTRGRGGPLATEQPGGPGPGPGHGRPARGRDRQAAEAGGQGRGCRRHQGAQHGQRVHRGQAVLARRGREGPHRVRRPLDTWLSRIRTSSSDGCWSRP